MDFFIWLVGLFILALVACGLFLIAVGFVLAAINTTFMAWRLYKAYPEHAKISFVGAWIFAWTEPAFAIRFTKDFEHQKKQKDV